MEKRHEAMFMRVLIAGTVFLATACVPIASEPAEPCISGERALLIGETIEAEPSEYLPGQDRIRCDFGTASNQQSSLSEADSAKPKPSSAKADLNDLASILAKMDGSESSIDYIALLQEFSDCFLSNLSAAEREEGLGVGRGLAISPAQITAVTMFQAGLFAFVGQFERAQKVDKSGPPRDAVNMYELLEGGLAVCEDSS